MVWLPCVFTITAQKLTKNMKRIFGFTLPHCQSYFCNLSHAFTCFLRFPLYLILWGFASFGKIALCVVLSLISPFGSTVCDTGREWIDVIYKIQKRLWVTNTHKHTCSPSFEITFILNYESSTFLEVLLPTKVTVAVFLSFSHNERVLKVYYILS